MEELIRLIKIEISVLENREISNEYWNLSCTFFRLIDDYIERAQKKELISDNFTLIEPNR